MGAASCVQFIRACWVTSKIEVATFLEVRIWSFFRDSASAGTIEAKTVLESRLRTDRAQPTTPLVGDIAYACKLLMDARVVMICLY